MSRIVHARPCGRADAANRSGGDASDASRAVEALPGAGIDDRVGEGLGAGAQRLGAGGEGGGAGFEPLGVRAGGGQRGVELRGLRQPGRRRGARRLGGHEIGVAGRRAGGEREEREAGRGGSAWVWPRS